MRPAFDQVEGGALPRRGRSHRPRSSRSARRARGLRGARRAAAQPAFAAAMPRGRPALGRFATSGQTQATPKSSNGSARPAPGRAQRGAGVRLAIHGQAANISRATPAAAGATRAGRLGRPAQHDRRAVLALDATVGASVLVRSAAYGEFDLVAAPQPARPQRSVSVIASRPVVRCSSARERRNALPTG